MGVQELKHEAKLREWSEKVTECRMSGKGVRIWYAEKGVSTKTYYHWKKLVVMKAAQQHMLPAPAQGGTLVRIEPETLAGNEIIGNGSTIHHGESVISLPAGSGAEAVANLVKALNGH